MKTNFQFIYLFDFIHFPGKIHIYDTLNVTYKKTSFFMSIVWVDFFFKEKKTVILMASNLFIHIFMSENRNLKKINFLNQSYANWENFFSKKFLFCYSNNRSCDMNSDWMINADKYISQLCIYPSIHRISFYVDKIFKNKIVLKPLKVFTMAKQKIKFTIKVNPSFLRNKSDDDWKHWKCNYLVCIQFYFVGNKTKNLVFISLPTWKKKCNFFVAVRA